MPPRRRPRAPTWVAALALVAAATVATSCGGGQSDVELGAGGGIGEAPAASRPPATVPGTVAAPPATSSAAVPGTTARPPAPVDPRQALVRTGDLPAGWTVHEDTGHNPFSTGDRSCSGWYPVASMLAVDHTPAVTFAEPRTGSSTRTTSRIGLQLVAVYPSSGAAAEALAAFADPTAAACGTARQADQLLVGAPAGSTLTSPTVRLPLASPADEQAGWAVHAASPGGGTDVPTMAWLLLRRGPALSLFLLSWVPDEADLPMLRAVAERM